MKLKVININTEKTDHIELSDKIFSLNPNKKFAISQSVFFNKKVLIFLVKIHIISYKEL